MLSSAKIYSTILILCSSLVLPACGFHLRGSSGEDYNLSSIYVVSRSANGVTNLVERELEYQQVETTASPADAEYVITLANESQERNVLTVSSSTGKVQEYELIVRVDFSLADSAGNTLVSPISLSANRDLFFDENAVLAISQEENTIYQELRQQLANTVLRRTEAATRQAN